MALAAPECKQRCPYWQQGNESLQLPICYQNMPVLSLYGNRISKVVHVACDPLPPPPLPQNIIEENQIVFPLVLYQWHKFLYDVIFSRNQ